MRSTTESFALPRRAGVFSSRTHATIDAEAGRARRITSQLTGLAAADIRGELRTLVQVVLELMVVTVVLSLGGL